jgi:micrococcal nuclease
MTPAWPAGPPHDAQSRRSRSSFTRYAIAGIVALIGLAAVSNLTTLTRAPGSAPAAATSVPAAPASDAPVTLPTTPLVAAAAPPPPGPTFGPAGPTGPTMAAHVVRVVDGDTIHVEINGVDYPLRYIGMDTPETNATDPAIRAMADAATQANATLVDGRDVILESDVSETDRYGRLLRDVWVNDASGTLILVNLTLVERGFAQVATFPPDVKYVDLLMQAQASATTAGLGLWGAGAPGDAGNATPEPTDRPAAKPTPTTPAGSSCHPSYSPCLPVVADLDCPEVRAMGKAPVKVKGPDVYRLDRDHDGLGCE